VRGVSSLDLIDAAFPGRAAFDVAVSRALLREVAAGKRPETLRLYRPDDVVAFSTTDLRRPGFTRAAHAAQREGFDAALRLAGGAAAVFTTETLAFAWCTPETDERAGIHARFARVAEWVARALRRLGVDARVGEVSGAYCPGDWSVNARGQRKLMGVGQRVVRGAAHTGGVIVVGGSDRMRAVLVPVYAELDFPFLPHSAGAIEDEIGPVSLDAVREALLAELPDEPELRAVRPDSELLDHAARFESSHRISS
jgi:octanoyl-[GcvH]:protein N-octanoyltransferase